MNAVWSSLRVEKHCGGSERITKMFSNNRAHLGLRITNSAWRSFSNSTHIWKCFAVYLALYWCSWKDWHYIFWSTRCNDSDGTSESSLMPPSESERESTAGCPIMTLTWWSFSSCSWWLDTCMGMGKTGIPWVSYGIPTGMGIRPAMGWEWE